LNSSNSTVERRIQQYSITTTTTTTRTSTSMNCAAQDHSPTAPRTAKKAAPKGLTDLAINVSKAYRHECSPSSPSGSSKKTRAVNTRNSNNRPDHDRRSRARTKQRDKKRATATTAALHSSRTNSTTDNNYRMMYVNSDLLDPNIQTPVTVGQKNVGIGVSLRDTGTTTPSSQDRRGLEPYNNNNNYQSSANHSPNGVDDDTATRGKELVRRKQSKTTDTTMGLFTIQDQIQVQDLYDAETRKNRDLSNIVSQLENEISTLQVSMATNAYNNGTETE